MTRRRATALFVGALIVVFVIGGAIGVITTRAQLLSDLDQRLRDNVESFASLVEVLPQNEL